MLYFISTSSVLLSLFSSAMASLGNTFPTYRYCVEQCRDAICEEGIIILNKMISNNNQKIYTILLLIKNQETEQLF